MRTVIRPETQIPGCRTWHDPTPARGFTSQRGAVDGYWMPRGVLERFSLQLAVSGHFAAIRAACPSAPRVSSVRMVFPRFG